MQMRILALPKAKNQVNKGSSEKVRHDRVWDNDSMWNCRTDRPCEAGGRVILRVASLTCLPACFLDGRDRDGEKLPCQEHHTRGVWMLFILCLAVETRGKTGSLTLVF